MDLLYFDYDVHTNRMKTLKKFVLVLQRRYEYILLVKKLDSKLTFGKWKKSEKFDSNYQNNQKTYFKKYYY